MNCNGCTGDKCKQDLKRIIMDCNPKKIAGNAITLDLLKDFYTGKMVIDNTIPDGEIIIQCRGEKCPNTIKK